MRVCMCAKHPLKMYCIIDVVPNRSYKVVGYVQRASDITKQKRGPL